MHGGFSVSSALPSRPNLDHLRRQAKTLLAQLHDGDASAISAFREFLPAAKTLTPAKVRSAGFRLADAQSVVARRTGFASWPLLGRHVQDLRAFEGQWTFVALEVDGVAMPAAALGASRLLIDGDRFRMESPEANYEGIFTLDVGAEPPQIDMEFVEGPEAGNWSYGIYELQGDQLTLCLGLTGAPRPVAFRTQPGTGHALERLRRATTARPATVHGGTRQKKSASSAKADLAAPVDATAFDGPLSPMLQKLGGHWVAVELIQGGKPMPPEWLSFGSRTTTGNEMKVVFGGQTMVHAKMRIDETATPVAIDYLHLSGAQRGRISEGILEWIGDEVRVLMPAPGQPRPASFTDAVATGTLSRWRRTS